MFMNSIKSKVGSVSTRNTLRNIEQYRQFNGICVYEWVITQLYRQVWRVLFSNLCCHNIKKGAKMTQSLSRTIETIVIMGYCNNITATGEQSTMASLRCKQLLIDFNVVSFV